MKIFICIKQVPSVTEVHIDAKTGILLREGIPGMINPVDKNALELALQLKSDLGAETIAISMGPSQAEEALREALALGIDKVYLLTDIAFAGADTLATSHTLALGIKKILKEMGNPENYLVVCGAQAIDGDTAQVGPELAEELNIPQITYVQKVEVKGDKIVAESVFRSDEFVVLETRLPALITVLKDLNMTRFPTISGIVEAHDDKEVVYLDAIALGADKLKVGMNGSQTQVWKIFVPEQKGEHIILTGTIQQMVKDLCQKLREDKIL